MKVGFFDSGVGGTCILAAFKRLCPGVETVYLADREHFPYGNRPPDEIRALADACTRELLAQGCRMIVVACNTATAAAIDTLRARYPDVPFVGLEPAVKPAALHSKTGVVGVLATAGTFHGRLYNETKARFAQDVTVLAVVADEFVEIVEKWKGGNRGVEKWKGGKVEKCEGEGEKWKSGRVEECGEGVERWKSGKVERCEGGVEECGEGVEKIVRAKIEPLLRAGADMIVLGCTHFPHLKPLIEKVCAGRAEVIDPSEAVARQARRLLEERGWL